MNNTPKLIVMVGLPGSGKDYWISNFVSKSDEEWVVVSTDHYIETAASQQGKTYSEVFDTAIQSATAQVNLDVSAAIRERKNVIWNQTNMTSKKRASIVRRFPKEYEKVAVVVTVDDEVHQERLKARAYATGKNIPQYVMNSMRNSAEPVSTAEGFDDIIYVNNN